MGGIAQPPPYGRSGITDPHMIRMLEAHCSKIRCPGVAETAWRCFKSRAPPQAQPIPRHSLALRLPHATVQCSRAHQAWEGDTTPWAS